MFARAMAMFRVWMEGRGATHCLDGIVVERGATLRRLGVRLGRRRMPRAPPGLLNPARENAGNLLSFRNDEFVMLKLQANKRGGQMEVRRGAVFELRSRCFPGVLSARRGLLEDRQDLKLNTPVLNSMGQTPEAASRSFSFLKSQILRLNSQ